MRLTTTFIFIFAIFSILGAQTQKNIENPYTAQLLPANGFNGSHIRDSFINDTIPGQAMLTDSIIRMIQVGDLYKYEKVMSTVVVDAVWVKSRRFLVRASDGGVDPFDLTSTYFFITGGTIDPRRILLFKIASK